MNAYAWDLPSNRLYRDGQLVGFLQREGNGETSHEWLGFKVIDNPERRVIGFSEGSYVGTFLSAAMARAAVLDAVKERG
jgi:hypothetical protein